MSRYVKVSASSITGVNTELEKIEAAIDTMVDRNGTSPNQMEFDFDLNNNDVLNVNSIDVQNISIAGQDVTASDFATTTLPAQSGQSGKVLTTNGSTASWKYEDMDVINVKNYGAVGDGVTDDTAAFTAAYAAGEQKTIFIPSGTYLVDDWGTSFGAGTHWVGESRWKTIIKAKPSYSNTSVFRNNNSGSSTTSQCSIENLLIDLNGQNLIAIDLGGVGSTVVRDVSIYGGSSLGTATGTGIKFHAPLSTGSYSNDVINCRVYYLTNGVFWDNGGNHNNVHGGEAISCTVGFNTTPASGSVDTPRIFGARAEGCTTAVKEGASYGTYVGLRLESGTTGWDFQASSDHPQIFGGQVSSTTAVNNLDNAQDALIMCSDFGGHLQWDSSASRPMKYIGENLFGGTSDTPSTLTSPSFMGATHSAYFKRAPLIENNVSVETIKYDTGTGQPDGTQGLIRGDSNNRTYVGNVNGQLELTSNNTIRPHNNQTTNLGTTTRRFNNLYADSLIQSAVATGGTGSAGAGNQYVVVTINGVNYKLLHDGTV